MRKSIRPFAALLALAVSFPLACAEGASEEQTVDRDTLTRRQKDSIVGESGLPGAGAVQRALEASDDAADRAEAMDSLSGS